MKMLKLENSELNKQILQKKRFTANYLKIFYILLFVLISLTINISIRSVHADEITYYHNDISGTPLLSTNSLGEVIWKESYRPYGDKLNNQTESQANQIGFHGKPYDNESGLSYMQARYYNPTLGRFMGVDPVGYQEDNLHSFNRYAYANNNPYKYIDPDGNIPVDTLWDAANIVYDVGKIGIGKVTGNLTLVRTGSVDLAADTIAIAVPYLPAGSTKVGRMAGEKTYQTYQKTHPTTGEIYSGRTSGRGTALENIQKRDQNHHMNDQGFGPAVLDKTSKNPDPIRGREQQLIQHNGGAKSQGGTSGNKINGISPNNKNRDTYMDAAEKRWGKL
jgi:RHS repeat-associated protein